jgi:hypothetical protein
MEQQQYAYVPRYHTYIGYMVFAASVGSWRLASTSSPGIITAVTLQNYNHYPFDNLLFTPDNICKRKRILKLARSKYDRYKYDEYIPRFDHFCGWVFNTIGEENYRWFLFFLVVHAGMCLYGTIVVGRLFQGEIAEKKFLELVFVDRMTGEQVKASRFIVYQYLFTAFMWEAGLLLLMAVMGISLSLFLGYHIWLTSKGMTTNESFKWSYVNKWYKEELKRYNQAVKSGLPVVQAESATLNSQPAISVGDNGGVTCTPGTGETDQIQPNTKDNDPNAIRHPGPKPKNIYDRGFVENWAEVLFPISLRANRPQRQEKKEL